MAVRVACSHQKNRGTFSSHKQNHTGRNSIILAGSQWYKIHHILIHDYRDLFVRVLSGLTVLKIVDLRFVVITVS